MENQKTYKSFTDLDVWKGAREFKNAIRSLVSGFPENEKYRLTDQLLRAHDLLEQILQKAMADTLIKNKQNSA